MQKDKHLWALIANRVIIQPLIYEFEPFYIFLDYEMNKNNLFPCCANFKNLGEDGDKGLKEEWTSLRQGERQSWNIENLPKLTQSRSFQMLFFL